MTKPFILAAPAATPLLTAIPGRAQLSDTRQTACTYSVGQVIACVAPSVHPGQGAMDVYTDWRIPDTWQKGDPWPFPTFQFVDYPLESLVTDYVSHCTPNGDEAIRFAGRGMSVDYVLPKTGMVKACIQAAVAWIVVAQNAVPDFSTVMSPRPPHIDWDTPGSQHQAFNLSMTWCYVLLSSTFSYQINGPDGNVNNTRVVNIEIFECDECY